MRKIIYPHQTKKIGEFHQNYSAILDNKQEQEINVLLLKTGRYKGSNLTFKKILLTDFKNLLEIKDHVEKWKKKSSLGADLDNLFSYKANQSRISRFFMNYDFLNDGTCFYCGINYIHAFKNIGDYRDGIDFVNNASSSELSRIYGIGPVKAKSIIQLRSKSYINDLLNLPVGLKTKKYLQNWKIVNDHNHFTLDHILPQSKYRYLSLSLYNLVPSCYSCNSKFKKNKEFPIKNLPYLSPTSPDFCLTEQLQFSISYTHSELHEIESIDDFTIKSKSCQLHDDIDFYRSLFKLEGRLIMQKKSILELVKKRIRYPDSQIDELSTTLGFPNALIKKDIFGKNIFTTDDDPFIKLRRDIARQIKII